MVVHKLRSEHTRMCFKAMTWIVDKAKTEGSAAEVYHLNTATIRLCYKCPKDELGKVAVSS